MQGCVDCDQTDVALLVEIERFIELQTDCVRAAAFVRRACDRVIDQDPAHHPRGDAEKVGAVLPVRRRLADEAKINFVHQRRRLERMIGPLVAEISGGEPAQFFIGAGDQRGQRRGLLFITGQR